ncbi:flagellar motor switch protein FliG [Shimia biformata]|uniref:flagellar motor switch protein FliG n=1 Tax=Shimia biformata TaxID=1294299 RepID=UPI00195152FE|nr:FliG C-terminal domain-containing protein [Shimia biformata]
MTTTETAALTQAPPVAFQTSRLSRRQKAAIIVRFLLNEGAEVPVANLPDHLQGDLTHLMGSMRYVDRETLSRVVIEFVQELEAVGLSFPDGIGGALDVLEGRISPLTAARLRKEAGVRASGDPWSRLRALPVDDLRDLIDSESTEIAAVILSKLEVTKAAELLQAIPGDTARRITYAIGQTANITPEAVDRIGLTLASQLDERPPSAFADPATARVGAILNFSPAAVRESLLDGLQQTDAPFADDVRKAIFTFGDIPARIAPADVPRILREADPDALSTALAFALSGDLADAAEFLLGNTSKRLAEQLREDTAELGDIPMKDGEAAANTVIAAIRRLEDAGEISLIQPEDN